MSNTLYFTALSVPLIVIGGLCVALALQSSVRLVLRNLFKTIYFLPAVTSIVAATLIWLLLLDPTFGLLNDVLSLAGLPRSLWLDNQRTVIPALAMVYFWTRVGFAMIVFVAGLEGIPREYVEAGRLDGAGTWALFQHVTIPLLAPQFLLVGVVEMIFALKVFALPFLATSGGPDNASRTIVMHIYVHAFQFYQMGEAAVGAVFLFAVILGLTLLQRTLLPRSVEY